jgi:hypothetical protein
MKAFFVGEKVRLTVGTPFAGVIESFTYDLSAIRRGDNDDIARVRLADGSLIDVPVSQLEDA